MCQKRNELHKQILHCRSELSKICLLFKYNLFVPKIKDANSKLSNNLHQIQAQKLDQPIGPQIISDSSPENLETVITIPGDLLLSDSEVSVKQEIKKFLRRVQLKAFFYDKQDDSNISNKDTLETLHIR